MGKEIKIFATNAALGHNQSAIIIRLDKGDFGYNYLCIDRENIYDDDKYPLGSVINELEDIYVTDVTGCYNIEKSPLNGTYLFGHFIENFKGN